MKRTTLTLAGLVLGAWLLSPAAAHAGIVFFPVVSPYGAPYQTYYPAQVNYPGYTYYQSYYYPYSYWNYYNPGTGNYIMQRSYYDPAVGGNVLQVYTNQFQGVPRTGYGR